MTRFFPNEAMLSNLKKNCPLEKDVCNIITEYMTRFFPNEAMLSNSKKNCPLGKDVCKIITENMTRFFSNEPNLVSPPATWTSSYLLYKQMSIVLTGIPTTTSGINTPSNNEPFGASPYYTY